MKNPINVNDNINGRIVLEVRSLPHPDDSHLKLVFCKYGEQYVSWLYNGDFGSFDYGRYSDSEVQGLANYIGHCEEYKIKY